MWKYWEMSWITPARHTNLEMWGTGVNIVKWAGTSWTPGIANFERMDEIFAAECRIGKFKFEKPITITRGETFC